MERKTIDKISNLWFWFSAFMILLILFSILGYIFIMGIDTLNISFIINMPEDNWRSGGIMPAILGSLIVVGIAIIFAAPIGIGTALYLTEFTREGKMSKLIRMSADSLNAVPSIVFGLFGLALFVFYLKDYTGGPSLLSAGLTLGFMILPTIIRTSEVSIRTIPFAEKMESYGLGASKLETIWNIVLPGAMPGIVTGIILSIGRAIGETAPIIFMIALNPTIPTSVFDSGNTLTTQLYYLTMEGISLKVAFGISLTLIIIILILNTITRFIKRKFSTSFSR
ncbi:MAG: phosphate ABC transporter permease PstA [Candidatus Altiarchaeota archaeon]